LVAGCQEFMFLAGPDQCEVPGVLTHPARVTLPIPAAAVSEARPSHFPL
jgi:hypothetical protein